MPHRTATFVLPDLPIKIKDSDIGQLIAETKEYSNVTHDVDDIEFGSISDFIQLLFYPADIVLQKSTAKNARLVLIIPLQRNIPRCNTLFMADLIKICDQGAVFKCQIGADDVTEPLLGPGLFDHIRAPQASISELMTSPTRSLDPPHARVHIRGWCPPPFGWMG